MKKEKLDVKIGQIVTLVTGETTVTGICSGLRVNSDMELDSVWVDGFQWNSFTIGDFAKDWKVQK